MAGRHLPGQCFHLGGLSGVEMRQELLRPSGQHLFRLGRHRWRLARGWQSPGVECRPTSRQHSPARATHSRCARHSLQTRHAACLPHLQQQLLEVPGKTARVKQRRSRDFSAQASTQGG